MSNKTYANRQQINIHHIYTPPVTTNKNTFYIESPKIPWTLNFNSEISDHKKISLPVKMNDVKTVFEMCLRSFILPENRKLATVFSIVLFLYTCIRCCRQFIDMVKWKEKKKQTKSTIEHFLEIETCKRVKQNHQNRRFWL